MGGQELEEQTSGSESGPLSGVPNRLPELARAHKLQERAAHLGFDWPDAEGVFEKLREETGELECEFAKGDNDGMFEEIGDLMFTVVNLARHIGVHCEPCLRAANAKFKSRFEDMAKRMNDAGIRLETASLDEMEEYWRRSKNADVL